MLLWPVIGAIVVQCWEPFRDWAYNGRNVMPLWEVAEERTALKMGLAAIWPLTITYSLVVYPAMGIIHRLF
jgi:hypothetical protein